MVDQIHASISSQIVFNLQAPAKQEEFLRPTILTAEELAEFEDCEDDLSLSTNNSVEESDNENKEDTQLNPQVTLEEEPISSGYVENEMGGLTPTWLDWAEKVADFSESVIGSKLVQTGKAVIGENVGMLVGVAFPEASIAYAAGKAAANRMVGDSENKKMIVQGAGVFAALTATALTKSLSYLTGAPIDYGQALGYMVTAGGTIAGGMNGLEVMGQDVPDGYIPRTAAYVVTTGAVGGAVSAVASVLPNPVSTTISVSGGILKTISGTAAYYAPETATLVDKVIHPKPRPGNLYDPGAFVQNVAKNAHGDSSAFSSSLATSFIDSPLLSSIAQMLLKQTIDKKMGTNATVRALNEFAQTVQDKGIQQKINAYKAAPTQEKKDLLIKEIDQLIEKKYGFVEKRIATVIRKNATPHIPTIVNQLVDLMSKKETEFFGMELSNSKQTQALLELLLPSLIPLIGIYSKRELTKTPDLTTDEIEKFYQTTNEIIFAPYDDYLLARGTRGLISAVIPVMQQKAQFIPGILSEKIGEFMVTPVISLDDDAEFNIPETPVIALDDDAMFNIPKSSRKEEAKKPASKKTVWGSFRDKIRMMRYLIRIIGVKKFFAKVVGPAIVNTFIIRKSKRNENNRNSTTKVDK